MSDTQLPDLIAELEEEKKELLIWREVASTSLDRVKADRDAIDTDLAAALKEPGVTQHQSALLKRTHLTARRELATRQNGLEGVLRENMRNVEFCNASLRQFRDQEKPQVTDVTDYVFMESVAGLLTAAGWTVEPPA